MTFKQLAWILRDDKNWKAKDIYTLHARMEFARHFIKVVPGKKKADALETLAIQSCWNWFMLGYLTRANAER